jgi:hypothetical protein
MKRARTRGQDHLEGAMTTIEGLELPMASSKDHWLSAVKSLSFAVDI